jgi:metal-sulfur cluster biosynthetic enzyme
MKQQPGTNRPVWKAEKTDEKASQELKEALKAVVDPELGLDVIQLGLIRQVILEPDHVLIEMILTTPFCPYAGSMIEMVRQKADEALKRDVSISLGTEVWDFSMMEEGLIDDWGLYFYLLNRFTILIALSMLPSNFMRPCI